MATAKPRFNKDVQVEEDQYALGKIF